MRLYDLADIERNIEDTFLQRGRGYLRQGRVISAEMSADGRQVIGETYGSGRRTYRQIIKVRQNGSGMQFDGSCSCPVGHNCKHVAAVLLEGLERPKAPAATVANDNGAEEIGAASIGSLSLDPLLKNWLDEVGEETVKATDPNAYPDDIKQRLIYILNPGQERHLSGYANCGSPKVQMMSVRLLKNGGFGKGRSTYDPGRILNNGAPKYMRPIDLEILRDLHWSRATGGQINGTYDGFRLDLLADGVALLQKMLHTGRCYLGSADGPLLSLASKRHGEVVWHKNTDGTQKLVVHFDYANAAGEPIEPDLVLPLQPPFFVDVEARSCGPLDLGMEEALAQKLVAAPSIAPREAPLVVKMLEERLPRLSGKTKIPLPEAPEKIEMREVVPKPVLRLIKGHVKYDEHHFESYYYSNSWTPVELPLARLCFDYDGREVQAGDKSAALELVEEDRLVIISRDVRVEQQALATLGELGFSVLRDLKCFSPVKRHQDDFYLMPDEHENPAFFGDSERELFDDERFIQLSAEILPWLRDDKGWHILIADDYPYRIAEGQGEWYADIEESSGIDWFSFALGIEYEGQRLNLLPTLMQLIQALPEMLADIEDQEERNEMLEMMFAEQTVWHKLPDGRLLPLSGERMLPIIKALLELAGPGRSFHDLEDGKLSLNPMEAGELAGFDELSREAAINWQGHERLISLGKKLRNFDHLPDIAPPDHLKDILRPYQKEGLNWLSFLQDTGFGGALSDDMGLGKTLQALAFLLTEKAAGRLDKPTLILSPTSVLPNWKAEIQKFAPELSVLVLHGPDRKERFGDIDNHDVVLSTYPLLTRDKEVLLEQEFHVAILDEAQAIKNPKSQVSMAARQLKAGTRIAMTGTPLENNLDEVWSLFHFLTPGFLGDQGSFRRNFRTPIEKHGNVEAQKFLARRLKPFMLRRTKDEVALDLPPKTEIMDYVELEKGQRDLYETIRLMMDDKVREAINKKGLNRSRIIVLDALLKLRQVCCDPRLVKLTSAKKVKKSAKLERLMTILPEMIAEGRNVLLFSQFTSMLTLIEAELKKKKIEFVKITGRTKDRETPVKDFQAGNVPLFLISLKAGGTGLNLTAADTVIHYDPWWNPAVENQATDRAHRIGQDKPVFVHKLIVKDGVEEAIQQLKEKKSALAAALFSEKSAGKFELTEDDLAALFAPLDAAAR